MNLVETRLDPVAFVLVAFLGLLAMQYLFGFYEKRLRGIAKVGRSTVAKLDFELEDLGGFSFRLLIVFSIAGMFFEMMMIRWVSSEIRIFAYFKNFVLVACFFGFGLGCYFSKRRINLIALFMPVLLLCLLIGLPWVALRTLMIMLPSLLGSSADVQIWGMPSMPTNLANDTVGNSNYRSDFRADGLLLYSVWPIGWVDAGECTGRDPRV